MKIKFNISCFIAIILTFLIGIPYAGCLCKDTCCFPTNYNDGSICIQEAGHAGSNDCCSSEQCLKNVQRLTSHQNFNAVNFIERILAYQPLAIILHAQTFFDEHSLDSSPPSENFINQTALLCFTKTISILI